MDILLRKIQKADLELLMNWRMRPDITKYMFTDPMITMDSQLKWFERISKEDRYDLMIEINSNPVGYLGIYEIDRNNSHCSGGIYIAELKFRSLDNFIRISYNSFDFIFNELKMHKYIMVYMDGNPAEKFARYFGATYEGTMRDAIFKYGKYHNLLCYSMLDSEWAEMRKGLEYDKIDILL